MKPVEADMYLGMLAEKTGISEQAIRQEFENGKDENGRAAFGNVIAREQNYREDISEAEQQLLKLMLIDSDYVKLPEDIKDDVFNDRVSSSLYQAIQAEDKGERPLNMERLTEQLDVDGAQLLGAVTAKIIPGDRENEIYGDCIRFIRLNKLKNEEAWIRSRLSNPDLSREEMETLMQRQIEIQKKIKG